MSDNSPDISAPAMDSMDLNSSMDLSGKASQNCTQDQVEEQPEQPSQFAHNPQSSQPQFDLPELGQDSNEAIAPTKGRILKNKVGSENLGHLPLASIIPNPDQPRKKFRSDALHQLAQSILMQGIIQPLVVRPSKSVPGFYELVAGERRWRALQIAGIAEVPTIIRDVSDTDLLEIALLENIQRENLSPIEEALSYKELLAQHGYTQEVLARRIGKDRSTVANLIRLLTLPPAIQNDIEESRLTVGHARALVTLQHADQQLEVRRLILGNSWSVRQTEAHVRAELDKNPDSKRSKRRAAQHDDSLELQALTSDLEHHFGTKIDIKFSKASGKGHIKLDYYSLDDFDRILNLLKR